MRTALSGAVAKAAAFLPSLGIAPVAAAHLGAERFGALMTVMSLLAFLNVSDLGVGGNLVTAVSRAFGAGDTNRIRQLQSNGLVVVALMASVVALLGVLLALTSWAGAAIFPLASAAIQSETNSTLAVFVLIYAISMPLILVTKIQLGMQQGHKANYWQATGAILNFIGGALACYLGASPPWVIAGLLSGTILCGALNTAIHLFWRGVEIRFEDVRWLAIRRLLAGSASYLFLQIIFLITFAADTLIIAHHLGAQQASAYALAERLFSIVAVAVGIITAPLWAAYGEALGKGDIAWVRQSFKTSLQRFLTFTICACAVLVALHAPLIKLLGSGELAVPLSLIIAMAAWRIIESVGSAMSVFLYAGESVQFVLWCGAITAIISFLAKIHFVDQYGAAALPISTLSCYITLCLAPCMLHIRRKFFRPEAT